jgi:hypothetical protein
MFSNPTTVLAVLAIATRVALANPPACLIAAVRYAQTMICLVAAAQRGLIEFQQLPEPL